MEILGVDYFEHVSYRTANSCGIPSSPYISLQEVNSLVIYQNQTFSSGKFTHTV